MKIFVVKTFLFVSQTFWTPFTFSTIATIVCTETQREGTTSVKDYYQGHVTQVYRLAGE